jgi:tetratricopeptide (TPR) repeat protein
MEPSRQQAYLALIQQLLQCPSGEEPAVLESHQDLLDVEFLAMCEQVAQMLEEQEDQNSALWLRNLATQLGEVIAAGGSGGGAEQQGAFLMQLLRAIDESQSDPQVVYSLLRVNLPQLNSGVVALLDQWWEGVLTGADREQQQGLAGVVGNFGNLVAQFPLGNPGVNQRIAIAAYANALRVYTEAELPQAWATTNNNLGIAYSDLAPFSANPAEQIEKAIAAYANALRVYTEAELPQDYAMTNNNLGIAYSDLAPFSANPAEQIEKAIAAYANALRVMDPVQRSTDCLKTSRNLGNLGFTNNLPIVAIKGYLLAITAVENLRSVAIDPARKAEIVSQAIEVYANLVQVYVDQQRFDQALEVADRSKARNLVELLSTKDLYPKGEIPEDVIRRLDELRGSIAKAERELNRGENLSGSELRPEAGSGGGQRSDDNLRQLKQDLGRLIQEEIIEIDPAFSLSQKVQPLSIEQLRATLPDERSVLVSWYVAGQKLIAFILAKNSSEPFCHRYSEPTLELLIEELNSYFSAYASARSAWLSALPETLNRLSVLLEMEALVGHIAKIAPHADQLILVPHRFLHLLPLHSLPFGDPTTTLVDQFSRGVRFAPSLQVLDVVQKRPQTPLQSLFSLQNPTQDLLYTELEVAEIQSLFAPRAKVLQRQEATKAALAQQSAVLASSNCLHYACHGYFNFEKPELSALILAGSTVKPAPANADANRYLPQRDGSALDLNQCLTLLDLFELDLRQARLVALSACETGLS